MTAEPIPPHGGVLVQRMVEGEERSRWGRMALTLPRLRLTRRSLADVEMIANGGFSPLQGFMGEEDYESVLTHMRLSAGKGSQKAGLPWTIPVTLPVDEEMASSLRVGDDVALLDPLGDLVAILHLREKFLYDKERESREVYGTTDDSHPGVNALFAQGKYYLAGNVTVLNHPRSLPFPEYRLDPRQTRTLFQQHGWKRIVAFQTRNPVHRAHEYIQKCALEIADGLLLHPLVGETKGDDIPAEVRMECYKVLLEKFYPQERVVLSVLPANMRYAGPREAVFHAIIRKNYGCTHFIVGRDHAGVGNFYGTYDAHYIFDNFLPQEIGIVPLLFDHTFYCRRCAGMASSKTCPHPKEDHVTLSGTELRRMLREGQRPPTEFTRTEVADILIALYSKVGAGAGI